MTRFLFGLAIASLAYAYLGHGPVLALAVCAGIGVVIEGLEEVRSRQLGREGRGGAS